MANEIINLADAAKAFILAANAAGKAKTLTTGGDPLDAVSTEVASIGHLNPVLTDEATAAAIAELDKAAILPNALAQILAVVKQVMPLLGVAL